MTLKLKQSDAKDSNEEQLKLHCGLSELPKLGEKMNDVSAAFIAHGDKWEEDILKMLSELNDVVHKGDIDPSKKERASDAKLGFAQFKLLLGSCTYDSIRQFHAQNKRVWIYQPTLEPPLSLYTSLNLDPQQDSLSNCFPDFIELRPVHDSKTVEITVIDAKATGKMKFYHRIQVAMYYVILDSILESIGLRQHFTFSPLGGVWLKGKVNYDTFSAHSSIQEVKSFFQEGRWHAISQPPLKSVGPSLSKKCMSCTYRQYCKEEATELKNDLSLIKGIGTAAKTEIVNFINATGSNATTTEPLEIENIHLALMHCYYGTKDTTPAKISRQSSAVSSVPSSPYKSSSIVITSESEEHGQDTETGSPRTPIISQQSSKLEAEPTRDESLPATPVMSRQSSLLDTPSSLSSLSISTPQLLDADPSLFEPATPWIQPIPIHFGEPPDKVDAVPDLETINSQLSPQASSTIVKSVDAEMTIQVRETAIRIASYVKKIPILFGVPTRSISRELEDISVIITIGHDKPNDHIFGWSLSVWGNITKGICTKLNQCFDQVKVASSQQVSKFSDESSFSMTQISEKLAEKTDKSVADLERNLILGLWHLIDHLQGSLVKFYQYSKQESDLLFSIAYKLASTAGFISCNSLQVDGQPSIAHLASDICATFFPNLELIGLKNHPSIPNSNSSPLTVLESVISSVVALPLEYDQDLTHIYEYLNCNNLAAIFNSSHQDTSNYGLMAEWYLQVNASELQESTAVQELFTRRNSQLFTIVGSLHKLLSENRPCMAIGRVKKLSFNQSIRSFGSTCSKLLYSTMLDMCLTSKSMITSRDRMAGLLDKALGDKAISMIYVGEQPPPPNSKKRKPFHRFSFERISESILSGLLKDTIDTTSSLSRWIMCEATEAGVSSLLKFDDYSQGNIPGGRKFIAPDGVAFCSPFIVDTHGKELYLSLSFSTPRSASAAKFQLEPGSRYYLSEYMPNLTSSQLSLLLSRIDRRIAFRKLLDKLTTLMEAGTDSKQQVNDFLLWLEKTASLFPSPAKEHHFEFNTVYEHFFDAMGGYERFFFVKGREVADDPEGQGQSTNQNNTNPNRLVYLNIVKPGCDMEKFGTDLQWAIQEFMGVVQCGSYVPMQLLESPISWGKQPPSDWRDKTENMLRFTQITQRMQQMESVKLTPAQLHIASQVQSHKLSCIWGPPGTGKTFLLAAIIFAFTAAHRSVHKQRVRVSEIVQKVKTKTKTPKKTGQKTSSETDTSADLAHQLANVTITAPTEYQNLPASQPSASSSSSSTSQPTAPSSALKDNTEGSHQQDSSAIERWEERDVYGGDNFAILVVAFTHSAIDNLLERFIKLNESIAIELPNEKAFHPIPCGRVVKDKKKSSLFNDQHKGKGTNTESVEVIPNLDATLIDDEADLKAFLVENPQCIVGSTIWNIQSFAHPSTVFNMIVIDEASQMLLSNALSPCQWLPRSGRLVVVGDHQQLPPITQIEADSSLFPIDGIKYSKSIFEYLFAEDTNQEVTYMLYQNWRSCKMLTELPSSTIYKSKDPSEHFGPANEQIAKQRFWLQKLGSDPSDTAFYWVSKPEIPNIHIHHSLMQICMDASRPLVVVSVKQSPNRLNPWPQAQIIAYITAFIRKTASKVNESMNDFVFWRNHLMIVTPHHVQRHEIRNQLLSIGVHEWDTNMEPSIATVEKSQGREYDSIIMDYCILDDQRIANETRFLYSRNRINVAMTRARTKCIIFVSDSMLRLTSKIFQSKAVQEGFEHLQNIVAFARDHRVLYEINADDAPKIAQSMRDEPFLQN